MRFHRLVLIAGLAGLGLGGSAGAQESPSAIAARKKIQQKISVDFKEVTTKVVFDSIKDEMDKPVSFKIDTTTGMSLNTKWSYAAKDKSVEAILNDLADKFEFGWFVRSDPKDRYDGWVVIRKFKTKERGYESGKEPKMKAGGDRSDLPFLASSFDGGSAATPAVRQAPMWLRRVGP